MGGDDKRKTRKSTAHMSGKIIPYVPGESQEKEEKTDYGAIIRRYRRQP